MQPWKSGIWPWKNPIWPWKYRKKREKIKKNWLFWVFYRCVLKVYGCFRCFPFFSRFFMVFHGCMPSFSDFFMDFHVFSRFFTAVCLCFRIFSWIFTFFHVATVPDLMWFETTLIPTSISDSEAAISCCGVVMADLSGLPFPPSELSWDKLGDVMKHMKLGKSQACTVLNLVLGAPSVS